MCPFCLTYCASCKCPKLSGIRSAATGCTEHEIQPYTGNSILSFGYSNNDFIGKTPIPQVVSRAVGRYQAMDAESQPSNL
jgi:hypothetical protein